MIVKCVDGSFDWAPPEPVEYATMDGNAVALMLSVEFRGRKAMEEPPTWTSPPHSSIVTPSRLNAFLRSRGIGWVEAVGIDIAAGRIVLARKFMNQPMVSFCK